MFKLFATVHKELLILFRDRAGLLMLFAMPCALVIVISLIQENVFKTMGEGSTQVVFIDHDQSELGKEIETKLLESGSVTIVRSIDGHPIDENEAIEAIRKGTYQFCIVIPTGITAAVKAKARRIVSKSLSMPAEQGFGDDDDVMPEMLVFFDPAVRGGFRSAIMNSLSMVILGMEIKEKLNILEELLPERIHGIITGMVGSLAGIYREDHLGFKLNFSDERLIRVQEKSVSFQEIGKLPTSVQQNVPAWALFGMFFIVVPMSGALIRERQTGTWVRLLAMPVSYLTLLSGKVIAYMMICMTQFGIILLIGMYLLPLLGTPTLDLGSDPISIAVVAINASLAATGYGIMLGVLAKTYEQASMVGPISIVMAAALGGIMVPVYAMPKTMQQISHISPLEWGLSAFHDLFIRGGGLRDVVNEVLFLFAFFLVNIMIAWIVLYRQGKTAI